MASPRKTDYGHQITDASFSAVSSTVTAQGDNCDTAADRANAAADALDGSALSVTTDATLDGDGTSGDPLGVADNGVTNPKLANMAAATIKGRASGAGTGDPTDLTAANVRSIINVEDGATADQTGAEIKAAYEGESDTNAYTDAEKSKLAGIEASATADQSDAEIETAYNNQVDRVSPTEIVNGTETTTRRYSPAEIRSMVEAHGASSEIGRSSLLSVLMGTGAVPNQWTNGVVSTSSAAVIANDDGTYTVPAGGWVQSEFNDPADINAANAGGLSFGVGMLGAIITDLTAQVLDDSSGGATLTATLNGDTGTGETGGLALRTIADPGLGVSGFRCRATNGGADDMRVFPLLQWSPILVPNTARISDGATTTGTTWSSSKIDSVVGVAGSYALSREITGDDVLVTADEGKTLYFTGLQQHTLTIPASLDFDAPTRIQTLALGAVLEVGADVDLGGGASVTITLPPDSLITLMNVATDSWRAYYQPELTPDA